MPWSYGPVVVKGHLASKSNGRRKAWGGRIIKSAAALDFLEAFAWQVKAPKEGPFAGPVSITAWVYYADRRRDLDTSLLQDAIQAAGIIENDRAILEQHAFRFVDKANPRVVFRLDEITNPPLRGPMG